MVSKPSRSPPAHASRMPSRLAEIDVAGQLAHDQDVEARDHLGLQRGRVGQLRVDLRRAQVGEQARAPCAGRGSPAPGAWRAAALSYCGSPTAPNRMASASARERERRLGQRVARAPRSPRRRPAPPRARASAPARAEHLERLGNDLLADAVARQHRDFHGGPTGTARETARCRRASNARILSAWRSVRPISSRPFSRQCLRNGSTSKLNDFAPSVVDTVCRSRSTTRRKPGKRAVVEQTVHLRLGAAPPAGSRS